MKVTDARVLNEAITAWNLRAEALIPERGWRKLAIQACRYLNRDQMAQACRAAGWSGQFCTHPSLLQPESATEVPDDKTNFGAT